WLGLRFCHAKPSGHANAGFHLRLGALPAPRGPSQERRKAVTLKAGDGLAKLNALPPDRAREEFERCCGSSRWVQKMVQGRPYRSPAHLFGAARSAWETLSREDWLEAFR